MLDVFNALNDATETNFNMKGRIRIPRTDRVDPGSHHRAQRPPDLLGFPGSSTFKARRPLWGGGPSALERRPVLAVAIVNPRDRSARR